MSAPASDQKPHVSVHVVLKEISAKIREGMERTKYHCLSSLLYEIGRTLLGDEVGIIEDDPTRLETTKRRQIAVPGNPLDSRSLNRVPESVLTSIVRGLHFVPAGSRADATLVSNERCATFYFGP